MSFRPLNIVQWALYVLMAVLLIQTLGAWSGVAAYFVFSIAGALLAGYLLNSSKTENPTWKNYVAGWLLPWTSIVGGGTLRSLVVKNILASLAIGIAIVGAWELKLFEALAVSDKADEKIKQPHLFFIGLTIAGWLALLIGWIWLLKTHFSRRSEPISTLVFGFHRKAVPLVLPPVVLCASLVLFFYRLHWLALIVVWAPLILILLPVILMALVILGCTLMGKPIRWN